MSPCRCRGDQSAGVKTAAVTNLNRDTTYYFGVIAVDLQSNALTSITGPVSVVTHDIVPPPNPASLRFDCSATNLVLRWDTPANPDGDLAGYRLYVTNNPIGIPLPAGTNSFTLDGLTRASAYPFRITSLDNDGNESAGASATGVTWLDNPTGLSVQPYSSLVDLWWNAVGPRNISSTTPSIRASRRSPASPA